MESAEIRKLRAVEKIKKILEEEQCILQTKITIVGKVIVDDQVIVSPLEVPDTLVENPTKQEVVVEPPQEGEQ